MAQELTKIEGGAVALGGVPEQHVLTSDMVLPRVLLQQGLSKLVADRKAVQGDLIRTLGGGEIEKIGSPDQAIDFIPLKVVTEWREQELVGKKYEFRRTLPRTPANEDLPWEFEEGGGKWQRLKSMTLYALLVNDVTAAKAEMAKLAESGELPDLNKTLLPVAINFRSSAGRGAISALTNFYVRLKDAQSQSKVPIYPYGYQLTLSCKQVTNTKGTFYVFEAGNIKSIKGDLLTEAARWYATVNNAASIKVAEDIDADDVELDDDAIAAKKANVKRAQETKRF